MKTNIYGLIVAAFGALALQFTMLADDGELSLTTDGTNSFLQVIGDSDDDWRFQASSDLVTWTNLNALSLLAGEGNGPYLSLGTNGSTPRFFRAVQTEGLFDVQVFRTINLTFTQANWQTLLANNYASGANLGANFGLNNGATNTGVGVRYKGNTSYSAAGAKKSLNIELDYTNSTSELMGHETINLNNAFGDETIMREPLFFNIMRQYTVCPAASFVKLYINGAYFGVYSFVQQENSDLLDEWFPSDDGDRWRAPNIAAGGGGFNSGASALTYLGDRQQLYSANYELKNTQNSTNAWTNLIYAITVLNNTTTDFRNKVETVLAVDRWLWFLAIENVFADDDSYFNKGADYIFYYEPESGRIHPIEHDGNEAFTAGDVQLSPVQGTSGTNRPVIAKLLAVPELRQRYLAHMRTVLQEYYNPTVINPIIDQYHRLTVADIITDPKKNYTMTAYTNDLTALKTFVAQRYAFLTNHAELRPLPPVISDISVPSPLPYPDEVPYITTTVTANGTNGLNSVWLYFRGKSYGVYTSRQMFDDGAHGDGAAGDGIFGAALTNYPAGTRVRYYVEARSANAAQAAAFYPARAEQQVVSYRVATPTASSTPVVINELLADNADTLQDPQGDFDDWIELYNQSDAEVDMTGRYLTDEPNNPRKWQFPDGTTIPAGGYLLIWADEDSSETPGIHASFRLSASGEELYLIDIDANDNAILDSVTWGIQELDRSYGRSAENAEVFTSMTPTPNAANE